MQANHSKTIKEEKEAHIKKPASTFPQKIDSDEVCEKAKETKADVEVGILRKDQSDEGESKQLED